jgi:hypothetical protein
VGGRGSSARFLLPVHTRPSLGARPAADVALFAAPELGALLALLLLFLLERHYPSVPTLFLALEGRSFLYFKAAFATPSRLEGLTRENYYVPIAVAVCCVPRWIGRGASGGVLPLKGWQDDLITGSSQARAFW